MLRVVCHAPDHEQRDDDDDAGHDCGCDGNGLPRVPLQNRGVTDLWQVLAHSLHVRRCMSSMCLHGMHRCAWLHACTQAGT